MSGSKGKRGRFRFLVGAGTSAVLLVMARTGNPEAAMEIVFLDCFSFNTIRDGNITGYTQENDIQLRFDS